jgi:menaquinone-dependent protoporphyrinogen IX oxidase
MKGAIFFSSRYGSTEQYSQWIAEATSLPVFNLDETKATPAEFDFLVLGGPVVYHKLAFHRWVKRNLTDILGRPNVFFSVSGAGAGAKLDGWIAGSLPAAFVSHATHVALRGRQTPGELNRFDRMMLIIGSLLNRDRKASKEELHGFDFMDKASIKPIVERIRELQARPS